MVGEFRFRDHLPSARRPLHPPERRGGRPEAAQSRRRRSDVHVESGHRRRRARDRGELGLGRGSRRRARRYPITSGSTAPGRMLERDAGSASRSPSAARRTAAPSEETRPRPPHRAVLPRRRPARAARPSSRDRCDEVYGPARDIEWAIERRNALPASVPRNHHRNEVLTNGAASEDRFHARRPDRSP